ncbi:MAG: hypothetical protein Q9163_002107 [Psora crenata]
MREDPPPDARCRDKFLVQSIAITPERDLGSVTAITAKEAIEEKKIRVVFLPAEGAAATPDHKQVNGLHTGVDAPQTHSTGTSSYGSPAPEAVTPNTRSIPTESRPSTETKSMQELATYTAASASSTIGGAASYVANSVPTSGEDVKAQLAPASKKIASINSQIEDQGLRQRRTDAVDPDSRERISTGTTAMGVQQQPATGVPVKVVAVLCLLSFLLGYFFF